MLKYPKKSHRKTINLPLESEDLAEFIGIIFGDGGVNNDWQLNITLNSVADLEYSGRVRSLIESLFHIVPSIRKRRSENAFSIVCSSINLLDFLFSKGVVKGNKINQDLDVPSWIRTNIEFSKSFIKGLVDTDGCLYVHKHGSIYGKTYYNLGFCFTNHCTKLVSFMAKVFEEFGIKSSVTDEGKRLYIYNQNSIQKYLNIFRTSNPRITRKLFEWRDLSISYRLGEVA